ncbi:dual specificity phosphatase catalytic domain protein [Xylariaceae sp. FL0804]|nr:dual specificity phosphatase catalytic domain protein [Xylariaceae sp. FL0804]
MDQTWDDGPDATDPPLLREFSKIESFRAEGVKVTYPAIRVFYRRHPRADELPKDPAPLPLLVFIHGLGGSVAQFYPLLTSLVNSASCLALDFPGCGRSEFSPTSWDAYTPEALVDLVETVVENYREKDQGVVLIAHSMGTVIAARIANGESPHPSRPPLHVMGLIAICPVSGPPREEQARNFRMLLWVPEFLFDLWRAWDRWGGPESASVKRFVGAAADRETRQLQNRFNSQSRTPVFRRMAWALLPTYSDGQITGGLFGKPTWAGLNIPVYLIGGEEDHVTPVKEVRKIEELIGSASPVAARQETDEANGDAALDAQTRNDPTTTIGGSGLGEAAAPVNTSTKPRDHMPQSIEEISDADFLKRPQTVNNVEESYEDPSTPRDYPEFPGGIPPQPVNPTKVVKSSTLPAGHALLYVPATVRTLAGLIGDFMNEHITGRFSLGWQLQYLSREGKWDVKNLAKWKRVQPVSEPIGGIFRAMKTLREADEEHCPKVFAANWGNIIKDVIDISKAEPVYDARNFGEGIRYHKFPTVSKIPPTDKEIADFIKLVDEVREDQRRRSAAAEEPEGWDPDHVIGVHCHYGFNRTGYFVVCYLIERCGYGVQEAIDSFAAARPNGIRHSHFLDRLFLRYSGLGT